MNQYDVTVIGSGPGGYVAAIRCAQLGLKTALIEKYPTLGGTCLNVGCIPSKALLDSSEHYHNAHSVFAEHGIGLDNLTVDMNRMIDRKAGVVKANVEGIVYLMKKNKIDVLTGVGSFVDKTHISIAPTEGGEAQTIETKNVIIATGSKPTVLPFIAQDKERIITSTEALNIREVPKHMVVIGGGVIGLEMASIYARLGAKVSVVEFMDSLIPTMDRGLGKELKRVLGKIGIEFFMSHKVTGATRAGDVVTVTATNPKGEEVTFEGDYCLVAVGRSPYTAALNLEAAGIEMEERGRIKVDAHLQTNVPGIYAIGDIVPGHMLAHVASYEAEVAVDHILGHPREADYRAVPDCIFTIPEIASVGLTEALAKEKGIAVRVTKFPFAALGRAQAIGEPHGLVKLVCNAADRTILGMQIMGAHASDIIAEGTVAVQQGMTADDLAHTMHAHPTMPEAVQETAIAQIFGTPLHVNMPTRG